jgi:hypothetical protein
MTVVLRADLAPLVNKLAAVLMHEPNSVRQQQTLELLVMQQCLRMGSRQSSLTVAEGIHKHVKQLINQAYDYEAQKSS